MPRRSHCCLLIYDTSPDTPQGTGLSEQQTGYLPERTPGDAKTVEAAPGDRVAPATAGAPHAARIVVVPRPAAQNPRRIPCEIVIGRCRVGLPPFSQAPFPHIAGHVGRAAGAVAPGRELADEGGGARPDRPAVGALRIPVIPQGHRRPSLPRAAFSHSASVGRRYARPVFSLSHPT